MKAKVDLHLDETRPTKDGICNVKVRVYFNRRYRHYSTDVYLKAGKPKSNQSKSKWKIDREPSELDKIFASKSRKGEQRKIYTKLNHYVSKAERVINDLDIFTFPQFEKMYYESRDVYTSVSYAFDEKIAELRHNGQVGTAVTYESAKKSLEDFKQGLEFSDITQKFLKDYERWMLADGKSTTTVGMYLRNLRALFNEMDVNPTLYPFGRGKYEIPTGKNIKKALTLDEVAKIYNYEAEPDTWEDRAKNYWMFLYLANGMNVKDFTLLKWENIKGNTLQYIREKTKNTEKEVKPITIDLKPQLMDIINKYGKPSLNKEAYIFPHLTPGMSLERQRKTQQQLTKMINKYIKQIAKAVGIEQNVTTYFARHSFATILQRSGANISMISDLLGHSDIATTQNYLAGFEDEKIKQATDILTAGFNKAN